MNRAKKKQEVEAAPTPEDTLLLREIRDNLKRG
jgi:large-conductance mechanosensitive channel